MLVILQELLYMSHKLICHQLQDNSTYFSFIEVSPYYHISLEDFCNNFCIFSTKKIRMNRNLTQLSLSE